MAPREGCLSRVLSPGYPGSAMENNAKPLTAAESAATLRERIERAKRRPLRISATISGALYDRLQERAAAEGRSVSNLAAFLLESALDTAGL